MRFINVLFYGGFTIKEYNSIELENPEFLEKHALATIEFYLPQCIDNEGGFYCGFLDDGTVYEKQIRDLISTTRFVLNFSFGNFITNSDRYSEYIEHGVDYLLNVHRDEKNGGYHQVIEDGVPKEGKKKMYGHAFVLCAFANAYKAGYDEVKKQIEEVFKATEKHFWEGEHNLYAVETSSDFSKVLPYRGQNCNMHMTEALLAAYEATGEEKYLNKAYKVAQKVTVELAQQSDGMIWEHYDSNWKIDPEYNKDDPENLYRPYGFLPGHFTEWSKLLLILERYKPEEWQIENSKSLFKKAMKLSWDEERGGMNYTFDFDGSILNTDRYYWVHAESLAATYLLWERTGKDKYLEWYDKIWEYSLENLADDQHGGWYRVVDPSGKPASDKKSPPGKTDYHVVGACAEVVRTMRTD